MKLLDIILKWLGVAGGEAAGLVAFLERVKAQAPDLAPEADKILAALNTSLEPASVAAVAAELVSELGDIAQGKLNPKKHAGDTG